jgi:hypothetical protein
MTDALASRPSALWFVRLEWQDNTFVCKVTPTTGGIKGMVAFDATPAAMIVVEAPHPAQAVVDAWIQVKETTERPVAEGTPEQLIALLVDGFKEAML